MALTPPGALIAPEPPDPVRAYSFTDWQVNNPTAPPPGDRLDAEFDRANGAISQTLDWVGTSLSTDGTLRAGIVGESQLVPGLFDDIADDAVEQVQPLVDQAGASATQAFNSATAAQSYSTLAGGSATRADQAATDARTAATTAQGAANGAQDSAAAAASSAVDAANSANHADGSEAVAEAYADVGMAWAEHMPDIIPPNILAVQAVTGDHWSSRWWANQAALTLSEMEDLLLKVPPLAVVNYYTYIATAGQVVFSGPDRDGKVLTYAPSPVVTLLVHANGLLLTPVDDYTGTTDKVTFARPRAAGDIVQIQVEGVATTAGVYLPLTGGVMTGPITLAADPAGPMQPVTLKYSDSHYLPFTGGALSGPLTINGNLTVPFTGGFFADKTPVPVIQRLNDRMFVGDAANNSGDSVPHDFVTVISDVASYLDHVSTFASYSPVGGAGGVFASRSSLLSTGKTLPYQVPVGLASVGYADNATTTPGSTVWGLYTSGVKTATSVETLLAHEIGIGNLGATGSINPMDWLPGHGHTFGAGGGITVGNWIQATGDGEALGTVRPVSAGMVFLSTQSTADPINGTGGIFRSGILFLANSIYGADGTGNKTGVNAAAGGRAIGMAPGHAIDWVYDQAGDMGARIILADAAPSAFLTFQAGAVALKDTGQHDNIVFNIPYNPPGYLWLGYDPNSVTFRIGVNAAADQTLQLYAAHKGTVLIANGQGIMAQFLSPNIASAGFLRFTSASTGVSPTISTSAGNLFLGTSALPTTATDGMIQIPAMAGPSTGVPSNAGAGATLVYDATNNRLRVFSGGAWRSVALT